MNTKQIYNVPQSLTERSRLRNQIDSFVGGYGYAPPLSEEDLSELSDRFIGEQKLDPSVKGWAMVEIHNSVWRDTVASIPREKRLLLLPMCLRNSKSCEAEIDELGLLCHQCGRCTIPDLEAKAESLGVMSMVAEGFSGVIGLIENQVVDAVIGVSCLESLEKAFPLLINNAVPGLAIPLNKAGCKDTETDYRYVEEMIGMLSDKETELLDYDHLKTSIKAWFTDENLRRLLSPSDNPASQVAQDWLGGDGKRWRPYLLAAVYLALTGEKVIPEAVERAAIAVECFHKASLVHDDIQDNDNERYGKQTVHAAQGVPIAINIGDILLGEGYRLLTESDQMELLKVAAEAHINLCKGQGMELEWSRSPRPLTLDFVLDIFKNKTVPAFDVSLIMGLICAGEDGQLREVLHKFSDALGIAYQLLDDIEDFETEKPIALRPSAVLAVLCEQATYAGFVQSLLQTDDLKVFLNQAENRPLLVKALEEVKALAVKHRRAALDALHELTQVELKRLLFRVTKRILK